ncbi:MAG: hypothetical protein AAGF30_03580 [Pseudomonadota bacterium]
MNDPFRDSALGFLIAILGLASMLLIIALAPGGPAAVATIAGLDHGPAPIEALRLAAAADTLLPIGYTTGLCLLAIGLAADERGRLVAIAVIGLTVAGAVLDFLENGAALAGATAPGLTLGKYGALGTAAVILSGGLPQRTLWLRLTRFVVRWVLPFFLAAQVTGLPIFGAPVPFVLGLMGLFALVILAGRDARRLARLSDEQTG